MALRTHSVELVGVADPLEIRILLDVVKAEDLGESSSSRGYTTSGIIDTHAVKLKSPGTPKICFTPHCFRRSRM